MGSSDFLGFGSTTGGGLAPAQPGPYIFDPDAGVAITNVSTTSTVQLDKGQQYRSLPVADARQFPDQEGWLVLAFGRSVSTGPVRYLGRLSNTELMLDFSFRFPFTLALGVDVTLLDGRAPFVPPNPEQVGSFYLTASAAGRVAAQAAINDAAAAGITINETVVYPGDRGLGNEGQPDQGQEKINDQVEIWAGDAVDAEVDAARKA